jgi:hypothetical protein
MVVALRAFLDACGRAEVRKISLTDAPAVLGWAAWREIEAQHGLALITSGFEQAVQEGLLPPQLVEVLAQLVLSAVIEGALLIAAAEDLPRGQTRNRRWPHGSSVYSALGTPAPCRNRSSSRWRPGSRVGGPTARSGGFRRSPGAGELGPTCDDGHL